jgi:hypothetical protein
MLLQRPLPAEYNPYFQRYLDLVPDGEFEVLFPEQTKKFVEVLSNVPSHSESSSYAPGKWNLKELVQHIIDTDRVFNYRALVAARGDSKTSLCSMDENLYAANASVANRSLPELLHELQVVRESFFIMLRSFDESQSKIIAFAENHPLTARAMGFISIGHLLHHLNVLRERYSAAFSIK